MDPGSDVIGLLEQVVEVIRQTEEVVAVDLAATGSTEAGPVLCSLEYQSGGRSGSLPDACCIAPSQYRESRVCAVTGVDVDRTVRGDAIATADRYARPVEDIDDTTRWNVGVDGCRRPAPDTGVGDRNDRG